MEPDALEPAQLLVRRAARALSRHGLLHAYGHCSMRLDADHFLVCASQPPGSIGFGVPGTVVPLGGDFPEDLLGEVRIHRAIYRRRPDIGGVVRAMPPKTMSLSTLRRTPRVLHGMGSYFHPGTPLWDDVQLLRSDAQAEALVAQMGQAPAIVMRGNGVVVAGPSLPEAVVLTWYLEDAARIELDCAAAGGEPIELTADEATRRATRAGRIFERMWDHLSHGDTEV